MTPAEIELATFRFVAQHLNHCAIAVPLPKGEGRKFPPRSPYALQKLHGVITQKTVEVLRLPVRDAELLVDSRRFGKSKYPHLHVKEHYTWCPLPSTCEIATLLLNVGSHLPNNTVSHARKTRLPPTPPLLEPQIFEHAVKPHLRDSLKSHLIGNYTVQPYFHNRLPLSTYFIGQVNDPKCVYSTAQADDSTLGSIILQSI